MQNKKQMMNAESIHFVLLDAKQFGLVGPTETNADRSINVTSECVGKEVAMKMIRKKRMTNE